MNILELIKVSVLSKIKDFINITPEIQKQIVIDFPNNKEHGDIYTNAALIIAKATKSVPMDVAETLQNQLKLIPEIETIDIVKPGFINFKLNNDVWYTLLANINLHKENFTQLNLGKGEKINLEFVSANPTGPLHIGHARGAVFGDVLASLLTKVGYNVTREYYINDAGSQISKLTRSSYLRYKEALGYNVNIEPGLYPGDYLKKIGKILAEKYKDTLLDENSQNLETIKTATLNYIMELIKSDLDLLGVKHDVFTSEAELHEKKYIEKGISILNEKNLIYRGVLEKPKGKVDEDWSSREQLLFRSTDFGDDVDRSLQKDDGSWTYFASDIAYHFYKFERGFKNMILVLGSDHNGYAKRLKSIVAAVSDNQAVIDIKFHNVVNFLENGSPVKMSKRSGTFLTVKDIIEEVGVDIARFIMLTRRNDVVLDFDFSKVKEQSRDNPIFYIQYAHARVYSLLRAYGKELDISNINLSLLTLPEELFLIKTLSRWPNVLELAARTHEPHRISFYLIEVAEAFHTLWGYGNTNLNLRFIIDDNDYLTQARLILARSTAIIIADGLSIFNIKALEELR